MLKAILLIQVFPSLLALVATFLMISQIGDVIAAILGLDNHTSLILVYLGGSMGINIWLMKGYLDTIPRDIDESAMVEGATDWQIFTRLILPLLRPILVVIAIMNYIGTYGEFVLARVLLRSSETYTLMVGLQIFAGAQFTQRWGVFAAGALMGALPIMIIYLVLQDQIVGGLDPGCGKRISKNSKGLFNDVTEKNTLVVHADRQSGDIEHPGWVHFYHTPGNCRCY